MGILLWVLQILLALHTAIGAIWKFSNSAAQTMPSLQLIPQEAWIGLSLLELLISVVLVLPLFNQSLKKFVPVAAIGIVAEMALFSAIHLFSGHTDYGPIIYWFVVAALSLFVAYTRFTQKAD